jgi:nitrite reductase/ring-hydroxylating ferredoxin subunit
MFLRNAWYAAAWEREVGDGPHGLTLLGEHVVVYRTTDDRYAAVEDACPHRKLPLSMGRVLGDIIECGYHGLQYDCHGVCLKAPTHGWPAPTLRRCAHAIEARYVLLWMWMGDPADADPATIFPVEHWGDPAWGTTVGDDMVMDCNYLYITDNLLDPSHVAWVHPTSFAGPGTDDTPMQTTVADDGVTVWRWMMDTERAVLRPLPAVRGQHRPQTAVRGALPVQRPDPRLVLPGGNRRRRQPDPPRLVPDGQLQLPHTSRRRAHALLLVPAAQRDARRRCGVATLRRLRAGRVRGGQGDPRCGAPWDGPPAHAERGSALRCRRHALPARLALVEAEQTATG